MAPTGHTVRQSPQPVHKASSMTALRASMVMAPWGQILGQISQPLQREKSTPGRMQLVSVVFLVSAVFCIGIVSPTKNLQKI